MKIKVVSDLHLEFADINLPTNGCDVLILSGDIMLAAPLKDFPADTDDTIIQSHRHAQAICFRNFLRYCSEDFKHVVYVAGNHEFYHGKFYETIDILREECSQFSNVHFLEQNTVIIDDVLFVGGTLWTDCNKEDALTMWSLPKRMNDYVIIKNERNGYRRLDTKDTVRRHIETLTYFETVIANSSPDVKIVVVGHHAPSIKSIHARYLSDTAMNGGYYSNLEDFILKYPQIALWTHGHVHTPFDYKIGDTRILCNPRGYASEGEDSGWDINLTVEI